MLSRTNFVFPVFIITLFLLFACQKETIVDPPVNEPPNEPDDSSKYEGNFYGLTTTSQVKLPPDDFNNKADQILKVYVENNSIKVLNFVFPIDSLSQTHFDASYRPPAGSYGDTEILTLTYSADYNNIVLKHDYRCYSGPTGGCTNSKLDFNGLRTQQIESNLPHSNSSNLVGTYNLSIRIKDTQTNQDTQYVDSMAITTWGNVFRFGQKRFYFGLFNSSVDYNASSYNNSNGYIFDRVASKDVYWQNDSLSFQYSSTINNNGVKDTLYYSYKGRKQ